MNLLILQYAFNESEDSILGYRLCHKLAEEGHRLLVTTTTPVGNPLMLEHLKAKQLSDELKGSIKLLELKDFQDDEPSPEWIAKLHKTYYAHLYNLRNIDVVIGTLPGTTQTAVNLKRSHNCKLIILPTVKLGDDQVNLKREVNRLMKEADKIWSLGCDTYQHYEEDVFLEVDATLCNKHRKISLQPLTKKEFYWQWNSRLNHSCRKLVSVWSRAHTYFHRWRKATSNGSDLQSFSTFCSALGEINDICSQKFEETIRWHIHGVKYMDQIVKSLQDAANPNVKITGLNSITCVDELSWMNSLAFIVPDCVESFNYIALTAFWLGIPTLVPSQSSIGKFLLELPCPENIRAVVNLTGNRQSD